MLDDLRPAAERLRPAFDATGGVDGCLSLDVSPLLADNTAHTIQAASHLFALAATDNLLIRIPGTPEGLRAVEEIVFDGVPVVVGLLFSPAQTVAAAEAGLRGLERRLSAGLDPRVACVLSLSASPWDAATRAATPDCLGDRLGLAMAVLAYRAHREQLDSVRWRGLMAAGALAPRLLWEATQAQDPQVADMHLPLDGSEAEQVLQAFRRAGLDDDALAERLQRDGVETAALAWHSLLTHVREVARPDLAPPG